MLRGHNHLLPQLLERAAVDAWLSFCIFCQAPPDSGDFAAVVAAAAVGDHDDHGAVLPLRHDGREI